MILIIVMEELEEDREQDEELKEVQGNEQEQDYSRRNLRSMRRNMRAVV